MALRTKTLLIIGIALFALTAVLYGVSSTLLRKNLEGAERQQAQQALNVTLSVFNQELDQFNNRFNDWSAWDDTYKFVRDGNKQYRKSNLLPETFQSLNVELFILAQTSGLITYGSGFDLTKNKFTPIPAPIRTLIKPDNPLLQHKGLRDSQTGFIMLPEGPMYLVSQPIVTSKFQGPIRGTLVTGRQFNLQEIKRMEKFTRLKLTFLPLNTKLSNTKLPLDFQEAQAALLGGETSFVKPLSEQSIAGYSLLKDIFGQPALLLRVEMTREIYHQGKIGLKYLLGSLLVVGLAFGAIILLLLEISVLSRVGSLSQTAQLIGETGDLSARVDMKGRDEISRLGALVNQMLGKIEGAQSEIVVLNERLQEDNLRMGAELQITRQLQQMILPKQAELDLIEDLEIAGFMEPADEIGGDYYDVLQKDGHVKIGIGDVTGHGLESGVMMLMTQTAVRTLQQSNQTDPIQFLDILNRTLYGNAQRVSPMRSLSLALLDYKDGTLRLSGQHEEVLVVRQGGVVERVDTVDLGFPIGLDDDIAGFINFQDVHLSLGDIVVLYTDGITEARNMKHELYGLERLCEVAGRNGNQSAERVRAAIIEDVRGHIGEQKVFDDITLLVLKQR